MSEPRWLDVEAIIVLHDEQIVEHGGSPGVRDMGLLDSALARPRNAWGYGQRDLVVLAALHASGIMRNHPFVDGNKRAGFLAAYVFLSINGLEIIADEGEVVVQCLALASSEVDEDEFAAWLCENVEPR